MSEVFGDQTLIFSLMSAGTKDRLGIAARVPTKVTVPNCHFRPLTFEETVNLTDLATELWKGTVPPSAQVLSAKADDEVEHLGIKYQIVGGVKPYNDASSQVYKVTVICKKQT